MTRRIEANYCAIRNPTSKTSWCTTLYDSLWWEIGNHASICPAVTTPHLQYRCISSSLWLSLSWPITTHAEVIFFFCRIHLFLSSDQRHRPLPLIPGIQSEWERERTRRRVAIYNAKLSIARWHGRGHRFFFFLSKKDFSISIFFRNYWKRDFDENITKMEFKK